jgi:hypothetical protein
VTARIAALIFLEVIAARCADAVPEAPEEGHCFAFAGWLCESKVVSDVEGCEY